MVNDSLILVAFGGDKNVLELDSGDGCIAL